MNMDFLKKAFLILFYFLFIFCVETTVFADTSVQNSYAPAVRIASPAVVNVYTDRGEKEQTNDSSQRSSLGSGVIIGQQGYVLTNYHLVRHAKKVLVALDDGRHTEARQVGVDPETDLAVLHIDFSNLKAAELDNSDNVQVGDVVLAIGNPFGLGQTVTQGIVSAMGRNTIGINQLEDYIQTDAAINPGNSGGALINTQGKLIGINTGIYSRSGGFQGVGFAIPINVALNVMQQIIQTGSVKRGWLGVRIRAITLSLTEVAKLSCASGILIVNLLPHSPAAKAGMKVGDIVIYLNNQRVNNARGFLNYVAQRKPGSTVAVIYKRGDETLQADIELGTRPPQPVLDDRSSVSEID